MRDTPAREPGAWSRLIRAGAIGPVREVHAWTNRPIWPQAIDRPTDHPPVPSSLHWDLWLGPAPERPYHPAYHPFKWRGWWDFGTGALGDMGCHIIDAAFWALELREPRSIEAESPPISPHPETAPAWSIVRYDFEARGSRPPVKLLWYDGGKLPPLELFDGHAPAKDSSGSLFVGEKGRLLVEGQGATGLPAASRTRVCRLCRAQAHARALSRPPCRVDRGLQDGKTHGYEL